MLVTHALLAALIAVESGGNWQAIGDHGKARGALQIHEVVWMHVGLIRRDAQQPDLPPWKVGAHDPQIVEEVARTYLEYCGKRYELETRHEATPEVLARCWNGGPHGWKKKSTLKYWAKVKARLGSE